MKAGSGTAASPSQRRFLRALGVVALASAAGTAAMFTGVLLSRPSLADVTRLTLPGTVAFRPERDLFCYLGGGLLAFGALAGTFWREHRPREAPPATLPSGSSLGEALPILIALGSFGLSAAAFLSGREATRAGSSSRLLWAGLSAAAVLVCLLALLVLSRRSPPPITEVDPPVPEAPGAKRRWKLSAVDVVFPVLLVLALYTPEWRRIAGRAFLGEQSLHLDFFVLAPATAFVKGVALGTDLEPYYGLGWAVALTKTHLLNPVSSSKFIHIEVVYGCWYFIGVYAFLRLLTRNLLWSMTGTILAIFFQLFAIWPSEYELILWRFPSATVMRWAFDVWFFLFLLAFLRTGRRGWVLAAGMLVGLATFFQTETGLYLALSFSLFCILAWRSGYLTAHPWSTFLSSTGIAIVVLLLGLGTASRWTLFSGLAFWKGWLANIRFAAAGATLVPLTETQDTWPVVFFALMMATYLAVAGYCVVQVARRRATVATVMLACIAAYGYLTLIYFVGRSDQHNLFRAAVPFAILVAVLGCLAQQSLAGRKLSAGGRNRLLAAGGALLPVVALIASASVLASDAGFRRYPSAAHAMVAGRTVDGVCLNADPKDICGLPPEIMPYANHIKDVAARLRFLGASQRGLAVLDSSGTLFYLLSDAKPWGRYVPLFPPLFTHDQVQSVVRDLARDLPAIVVMRSAAAHELGYDEAWRAVRAVVEQHYVRDSSLGPFEIWERQPAG